MSSQASRGGVVVSGREAEVFDLAGEHLTQAEIGERLFISIRTVESHVASLRRKLGLVDHRALVRLAADSRSPRPTSELPHEANSFVGRLAELDDVSAAMDSSRVVTVVGPGGTGKTRLAIRAARNLSIEATRVVVWVDLTTAMSSTEVAPTLAKALGVVEPGRRTHEQAVLDVLGQRDMLIVIDNCEQVLDEVALVAERMLSACANVRILLTSRIRLAVPHEQVLLLGGLAVGSADDPGEAVELFSERARAGGADLGVGERTRVVDICRALDGMPLALELAAARVASIGLDGVEDGLGDHRSLLVGGARLQARHRSVSETVAWSYQLLTRLDQRVLSRVCTFRRPFSVDDAVAIAAYDDVQASDVAGALGRLAQHSLVELAASRDGLRYRLLETVRQFGVEQLQAESDRGAAERHLHWCTQAVADLQANEDSPNWVAEVDAAAEEAKGALSFNAGDQDRPVLHELAHRLAGLMFQRGHMTDSQTAFASAASLAAGDHDEAVELALAAAVAKCRVSGSDALRFEELAAQKALTSGDIDLACRRFAGSAELIARFAGMFDEPPPLERAHDLLDDARAQVANSPTAEFTLAVAAAAIDPDCDIAQLESLVRRAHESGESQQASSLLDAVAARHIQDHRLAEALDACRRRLDLLGSISSGPALGLEIKDALHTAIFTATGAGQLAEAIQYAERHARLPFLRDEPGHALAEGIAPDALAGNWTNAIKAGHEFLTGWERAGRPVAPGRGLAPAALAMVHGLRGDHEERVSWLETLGLIRGDGLIEHAAGYDDVFSAIVELHHGRSENAALHLARYQPDSFLSALFRQWHAALTAEAAVLADHADADAKIEDAAAVTEHNPIATALLRRARGLRDGETGELESIAADLDGLGCRYQAARTLSLAGGVSGERGTARLRSLGATGG